MAANACVRHPIWVPDFCEPWRSSLRGISRALRISGGHRRLVLRTKMRTRAAGIGRSPMAMKQATAARTGPERLATVSVATRVAALDWTAMATSLDAEGCARTGPLLTADECEALAASYPSDAPFRSRVIM